MVSSGYRVVGIGRTEQLVAQRGNHSLAVGRQVARRRKLEVEVQVARVALPYNLVVVAGARWRGRGGWRGRVAGGIAGQLAV